MDKVKLLNCFGRIAKLKKKTKELVAGDSTSYVERVVCARFLQKKRNNLRRERLDRLDEGRETRKDESHDLGE